MAFSVRGLAARQLADYRAGTPGAFFAEEDHPRLGLDGAYTVQAKVTSVREARRRASAGIAALNFKHGNFRGVPTRVLPTYDEVKEDPELLHLRDS